MKKKKNIETNEHRFRSFFPIGDSVSALLHPYAEVVLHDIESGKIVRIWNAFSSRKAGDPSYLEGASDLLGEKNTLGPYEKALASRGRTKSTTSAILDDDGNRIGYFCINLDVSVFDEVVAKFSMFAMAEESRPEPIYRNDLQEHINYSIRDYLMTINKTAESLSRKEKVDLVAWVNRDGIFQARNSVQMVASAIGVSRASIYNMLTEARERENNPGNPPPRPRP